MRQGGDPRLPLELALVKVTRPASDLSRESLAFRLERLEAGRAPAAGETPVDARAPDDAAAEAEPDARAGSRRASSSSSCRRRGGGRSCRRSSSARSRSATTLAEAHPSALAGDTLTLEFPQTASFHLQLAEDPKNAALLRDALYEVTGRKLAVDVRARRARGTAKPTTTAPASEEDVVELMKSTFDARELDE